MRDTGDAPRVTDMLFSFREATLMSDYSTDESRWAALVAREPAADGAYFYAVVTTGVFCRPSCASRLPRRANVRFFDSAELASAAGFRPCKRCQPEGVPRDQAIVARARAVLDAQAGERMTLDQLADAVHVSPFHLQRLFKRVTGLSPHAYQAAARVSAMRRELDAGAPVARAAADAGYGSSARAYVAATRELGMPPAAYRRGGAGRRIEYATALTSLGPVLVAATTQGVCKIAFGDSSDALIAELRTAFGQAELIESPAAIEPFVARIEAYLNGTESSVEVPLDLDGTAFRQRVWSALRQIPAGETRSYTQVAESLGLPNAVRAVASACAANPVALAIPCHRVVQKSGALAGYRWGLSRKAALLDAEQRHAVAAASAVESSSLEHDEMRA